MSLSNQLYSGLGVLSGLRAPSLSLRFVNLVACAPKFRKKCQIVGIAARIQFLIPPKWPFFKKKVGPSKKHHKE